MANQKTVKDIQVINIHAGHNPDGKVACGAVGLIKESTEARRVKNKVLTMLQILGKTVYDCTASNGTSQNDVLKKIVKKCNAHGADLDVSIHFNAGRNDKAGDGDTGGVEVYVLPGSSVSDLAAAVAKQIATGLQIRNRGVKTSKNLYVLNKTKASAMLIEVCFVDDKDDVDHYSSTKAAEAIVYALTGRRYTYGEAQEEAKAAPRYQVNTNGATLALRAAAGTSSKLLKRIANKTVVIGTGKSKYVDDELWIQVVSGDTSGWMHSGYLSKLV